MSFLDGMLMRQRHVSLNVDLKEWEVGVGTHPQTLGAVPSVLIEAVQERLLTVLQGRQLLWQPSGRPATAPSIQPLSERCHKPA